MRKHKSETGRGKEKCRNIKSEREQEREMRKHKEREGRGKEKCGNIKSEREEGKRNGET